jgi:hypothetical protein
MWFIKNATKNPTTNKLTGLCHTDYEVRIVATEHATLFMKQDGLASSGALVFTDADEWRVCVRVQVSLSQRLC